MPIFSSFLLLFFFSSLPSGLLICFRPRTLAQKRHPPLSDPLVDENGPMVLGEDRPVFPNKMELFELPMTSDPPTLFLVFIFSSSSIVFLHSFVFILRKKQREGGKSDFFLPPIGKEKIYPSTSARREDIRLSLLSPEKERERDGGGHTMNRGATEEAAQGNLFLSYRMIPPNLTTLSSLLHSRRARWWVNIVAIITFDCTCHEGVYLAESLCPVHCPPYCRT